MYGNRCKAPWLVASWQSYAQGALVLDALGSRAKNSRSDVQVATRCTALWFWLGLRYKAKSLRMRSMYGYQCKARWLSTLPGSKAMLALERRRRNSVHGTVVVAALAV